MPFPIKLIEYISLIKVDECEKFIIGAVLLPSKNNDVYLCLILFKGRKKVDIAELYKNFTIKFF